MKKGMLPICSKGPDELSTLGEVCTSQVASTFVSFTNVGRLPFSKYLRPLTWHVKDQQKVELVAER